MSVLDDHTEIHAELDKLSDKELKLLEWSLTWREIARPKQLPPLGNWNNFGLLAGRGAGKSKSGSHWIVEEACKIPNSFNAIIAPTLDDVRYTLLEGPTGIITETPSDLIYDYNISDHLVRLFNGAQIRGFSSESPRKLRGPQHHNVWGDEVAAWENAIETYDMMKFGLRLGEHPRFMWTTTPKSNKIVQRLMAAKNSIIVRSSSYENRANLSAAFWDEIAQYEGTKIGRQELHGEILDAEEDGIIPSSQIKLWPANKPLPTLKFILASLDTAFTEKDTDRKSHHPDQSVMQVWGVFVINREYHVILLDAWRDFLNFPQLVARVKKELQTTYGMQDEPMYRPLILPKGPPIGHQGKPIDLTLIEDKGSGISLRQQLASENILAHPYNPGRADKLLRLHMVAPLFAAGRVWMVESNQHPGKVRNWAEPVREALCTFRGAGSIEYDDDVDAASQALRYLKDNFMKSLTSHNGSHVVDSERTRGSAASRQETNPYAE